MKIITETPKKTIEGQTLVSYFRVKRNHQRWSAIGIAQWLGEKINLLANFTEEEWLGS
jgi:hypothetical protein